MHVARNNFPPVYVARTSKKVEHPGIGPTMSDFLSRPMLFSVSGRDCLSLTNLQIAVCSIPKSNRSKKKEWISLSCF